MKLLEAFSILRNAPSSGDPVSVCLACGVTPLHLATLLQAHLQLLFPDRPVRLESGLFGNLSGNLSEAAQASFDSVVVVMEWSDLDGRLGIRNPGGWNPEDLPDILETVARSFDAVRSAVRKIAEQMTAVVVLPSLPLPPVAFTPGWQASQFEVQLRLLAYGFASEIASAPRVRIVSEQHLESVSPVRDRWDMESDVRSGFPYTLSYASALAEAIGRLLTPAMPKKGLITDLDDTVWSGILGDVGEDGICWDLSTHSQAHGLYQLLLRSLAQTGVLIGVASRNDPALVESAFRRDDLLLPARDVFPFEVHWNSKAGSARRILEAWNISADSVVFVDDNPLELAEVQAAFPDMECLRFPGNSIRDVLPFLELLRDRFGKPHVIREDLLRRDSLKTGTLFRAGLNESQTPATELLRSAKAEITLDFRADPADPRPLELINKTNQFNLNGRRYTESEWQSWLKTPGVFVLTVSYKDKYSVLGKIAVITGRRFDDTLSVDTWVMSCRAFSRQIEYRCLCECFRYFDVSRIDLDFVAGPRNGPAQSFFRNFLPETPCERFSIGRSDFLRQCPELYDTHHVIEYGYSYSAD
jgi:FkbH-like protein